MLSQEHPSVSSSKFQVPVGRWISTWNMELWNFELLKGGAGGIEPLTSAFTEPRANRYTTCRIGKRGARSSELRTDSRGRSCFRSALRVPNSALPTVILGGLEPPISSVSGRRPEPLGHEIILD